MGKLGGSNENKDWINLELKHMWLTLRTCKYILPHPKTDGAWKWDTDNSILLALEVEKRDRDMWKISKNSFHGMGVLRTALEAKIGPISSTDAVL